MTGASTRPQLRRHAATLAAILTVALAAPAALIAPAGAAAAPSPSPSPTANCQGSTTGSALSGVALTVEYAPAKATGAQAHGCTPAANSTITGSWSVNIKAQSLSLASFAVSIIPAKSGIPPLGSAATVTHNYCAGLLGGILGGGGNCPAAPDPDTIQIGWDTTSLTPYNGVYEISATAVSSLGQVANTTVSGLSVNNPPVAPSGVSAGLSGTTPVISWSPNPEPDLTFYAVFRSVSGTAYQPVGATTGTAFTDASAPQLSALTYQVVAVRSSPVSSNGIESAASGATTALVAGAAAAQPFILPPPKLPPPPKVPALRSISGPAAVPQVDNTFNPTLPFGNAPNTTETYSVPSTNSHALASDAGQAGTTTAQKLRYAALASLLLVLAVFVIGLARKVLRSR